MSLTVTTVTAGRTYTYNGVTTGVPKYAEAVGPLTIRLQNVFNNTYQDYTADAIGDFDFDGVNPTTITQAADLCNAIVNFSLASGGSGAGFIIPDSATTPFADNAARDVWGAANLGDLIRHQTMVEVVNTPENDWYLWNGETDPASYDNSLWLEAAPVVRGPKGDPGTDGAPGAPGADAQAQDIANLLEEVAVSGSTLTFTRQDGTEFTRTVAGGAPGILPPPTAAGEFLFVSDDFFDASSGAFPSNSDAGEMYRVSVAGTVDSVTFAVGDLIIALVDNAATDTFDSNWHKVEGGVHSWGGLYGIITDQNIIDKLTRLGFDANASYAAPSVHNFSIDIPSRVDLNTDLNVSHNVTYDVTNRENIQSITLVVTNGDDKALATPDRDGSHTEAVVLSGIDTSSATTILFLIRIVDTNGNTHESGDVSIDVRDLTQNEFTYYGVLPSDTFAAVDVGTLTSVDVTGSGTQFSISESGDNTEVLGILSPANRDPISILDPLQQESLSDFTATTSVRTINGQLYNLLTLTNNSGFTGTFNYNVTTE